MEKRTLFWARTEVFASQLENCTCCLPFLQSGGLADAHSASGHIHGAFLCPYKHPQSHRPKMAALIKAITNALLTKVPLATQASEDVSQKPWSFVGVVERRPHSAYAHS